MYLQPILGQAPKPTRMHWPILHQIITIITGEATWMLQNADILARYKNFNSPQGNSPIADNNSQYSSAATLYPDQEDLNRDNTLNETEEYFQYTVDLKPPTDPEMNIGQNFIVDKKVVTVKLVDGYFKNLKHGTSLEFP